MNFKVFKNKVANQLAELGKSQLFLVDVNKDELWDTYLSSFPEGSDPLYKVRSEHNCNCCKQFIRTVGAIVAVDTNFNVKSIWDINLPDEPEYQIVADALSKLVKSKPIVSEFLHYEAKVGTDKSFATLILGDKTTSQSFEHFYAKLPSNFVINKKDIATRKGNLQSNVIAFKNSLNDISLESLDVVTDLILSNSIYKGTEFKWMVDSFTKLKKKYESLPADNRNNYLWVTCKSESEAVTKIRNSSIGNLLKDLDNYELEVAVSRYEKMVAPTNYRRPTALVTKTMVANAQKTIEELGFTSALERRFANLNDVSVNDVIFVDRSAKKSLIGGNVFDEISSEVKNPKKQFDKVESVSIEDFIKNIVPKAEKIEVYLENKNINNFVSLVAPVNESAENMFKWDNKFSWSYKGDVTDSIKELVKNAGGSVTGDVCCRLAWFNHDDLDFHMEEPDNYEIYFGNRNNKSPSGGMLDVDMNAGYGQTRTPVENIVYERSRTMKSGTYNLFVYNWSKRETSNVGFVVEVDVLGEVFTFEYDKAVRQSERIDVAKIIVSDSGGITVKPILKDQKISKTVWNIETNKFHQVNLLTLSPNYWGDNNVGNKHYFFMLDKCINDESTRGFYNEFLVESLNKHRKVLELVSSKLKTDKSVDQLSGLGFSSTKKDELIVKVTGSFTRTIKVVF